MKISVIIPTYKPDENFIFCLDSLEKQTFEKKEFEVIVILNGPREPYFNFINSVAYNSQLNFLILYSDFPNVSNARNLGIKSATGKYVTFIDADDWVSPSYLNLLHEVIESGFLPISNVIAYDSNNQNYGDFFLTKTYNKVNHENIYNHFKVKSYFSTPWAKLLPKNIVKESKFNINFSYGEDALFMFEIEPKLPQAKPVTAECIYYVRLTPGSLSRRKKSKKHIVYMHLKLLKAYITVYFQNITKYNFLFFLFRLFAVCKHIFLLK